MRLFFGDEKVGMSILEIKDFARYRDGGTTLFNFEYEGETYNFFSPSSLGSNANKHTTLNDSVIVEMDEAEKQKFMNDLNILHLQKTEPNGTDY